MANEMEDLIAERGTLTEALAECDRGAFPGSKEWQRENSAIKALAAFDAAHPDVHAEIMRRHAAEVAARIHPGGLAR